MVYILFIFSLPFQTPKWLVISLGFLLGFCMDMFSGTLGLNALATLIIAFLRPWIICIIPQKRDINQQGGEPSLPIFHDMGFSRYFRYASLLTFIHHFVFFFADAFTFRNFSKTFMVGLANTAFTLICIFIIQILFYTSSKRY
jgi:hypothetical protein